MNYFSVDVKVKNIPNKILDCIEKREQEVKRWDKLCKNKTSLLHFLKKEIYK